MRTCASPPQGPISCTASEDGILAQGTASVSLAATSLTIAGGSTACTRQGTPRSSSTCRPVASPATRDPCALMAMRPSTSCATQVVVPPDGMLSPLRCTEGTVSLPAQQPAQGPAQLPAEVSLEIQGGGEDCLRAEGQCTIDLDLGGRNLTLTGCARCIQAGGNADVRLTTRGAHQLHGL